MQADLSVRLRGNLVLCQETLLESASGLVVPENLSEQTKKSIACHRIVALGPDAVHKGLSLGERVLIRPGCPVYKLPDDSKRFAVHEDDILGTVDEDEPPPCAPAQAVAPTPAPWFPARPALAMVA